MKLSDIDATVLKITKKVLSKEKKPADTPEAILKNLTEK